MYDSWNEEPVDPLEDYVHVDELKKYEGAKEWMTDVLHHMYKTGDVPAMETALEELAYIYDVPFPQTLARVEEVPDEYFDFSSSLIKSHAKFVSPQNTQE